MVMGGIVPVVNVPGIKAGELIIDGPTLAKIFIGQIKKWNDAALKKLNPNAKLPDAAIAVVHRSDGSGTTFNFTYYLSDVSADWKSKVGFNTSVEWPVGIGAKGNEGVANNVGNTKNSIGYVEYAYALQNKLTYTKMMNKDGKTVAPTSAAFQAAAANADWKSQPGFGVILANQPGAAVLADDHRHLDPDVQEAGRSEGFGRGAQVLRLVLQERRQDGRKPRLRADAGEGRRRGRGHLEERDQAPASDRSDAKWGRR